ncbi:hypothetical protein FisN_5Lh465 [Fistulifera solaris]|uniref:Uncharacterized protein n=1 Tax=Fistulifera solaris TaxID=1519565 RepID=A0A1Z5KHE2_FISSO|nr:hypothetical protein FisN_5Lh465 [Fistulifera solaris]|eukprot:GAX25368.1 hypothetical protein FisN_5Lh465 [Fistulifera solaris]
MMRSAKAPFVITAAFVLGTDSVCSFQPIVHHAVTTACATASTCQYLLVEALATVPQSSVVEPPPVEALDKTTTTLVFLAGIFPFAVATVEFWRRIAVGDSFGTGSDSVVFTIGEDNQPKSSRGKQVLGTDSLITAYILFALAFGAIALALAAVLQAPSDPFIPLDSVSSD